MLSILIEFSSLLRVTTINASDLVPVPNLRVSLSSTPIKRREILSVIGSTFSSLFCVTVSMGLYDSFTTDSAFLYKKVP